MVNVEHLLSHKPKLRLKFNYSSAVEAVLPQCKPGSPS